MTSGILLLDKPRGMTSARALAAAAKLLSIKKAGHGGTLDPLASGLLILLFGEATRYACYLLHGNKRYLAELTFGATSDTDDSTGTLSPAAPPPPDLNAQLNALLPQFTNDIMQTVPTYSAVKYQGQPLYKYARAGKPVPAKTRRVHIAELKLLNTTPTTATLEIACGGGVYIRALARDLGAALGCGAYLSALQRSRCGQFNLADAITLTELDALPAEQRRQRLLPLEQTVADFPAITMPLAQLYQLGGGMRIACPGTDAPVNTPLRALSPEGKFAGLVQYDDGCYQPQRFLHWTRPANIP